MAKFDDLIGLVGLEEFEKLVPLREEPKRKAEEMEARMERAPRARGGLRISGHQVH